MWKWILAIVAISFLGFVASLFFVGGGKPSILVDFTPTDFPVRANAPFFYSIGNELRYSASLDDQEPAVFRIKDRIRNPQVSPNGDMLAFVDDDQLYIVSTQGAQKKLTVVDSIYHGDGTYGHDAKPIGRTFFRDDDFQWARDSSSLYLIRDQFYESKGSQLYSKYGELWRYDLASGQMGPVLKPFEAYQFFFGKFGIYYSVPTPSGDLQLRYFDGLRSTDIGAPNEHLQESTLLMGKPDTIFYTFDLRESKEPLSGWAISYSQKTGNERDYTVNGKHLFSVVEGKGFKGPYYCIYPTPTSVLPGGKYAQIDLSCKSYDGSILVDGESSSYKKLPKETHLYHTSNTTKMRDFLISGAGITAHSFFGYSD